MDKSPCIGCNLENEDKNSRTCVECSARVNYVSGLGGMTHSVPIEKTDLVGVPFMGTRNEKGTHKGMPLHMVTQKGRAAVKPQAKTGENKMTILKEKIEDIIEKICAEASVSVANLRAGRRGSKYTGARQRIAKRLIANYGMTQRKIGELTGVSNQAIAYLLSKSKSPKIPSGYAPGRKGTEAEDTLQIVDMTAPENAGKNKTTVSEYMSERSNTVTIDFSGRKELLNHLEKYAGEEIRSVEDQIMYFIQNQLSFEEAEADGNQG